MYMYFMSDAPVGMSWQQPTTLYLIFLHVSFYLIMYFQQFKWVLKLNYYWLPVCYGIPCF